MVHMKAGAAALVAALLMTTAASAEQRVLKYNAATSAAAPAFIWTMVSSLWFHYLKLSLEY